MPLTRLGVTWQINDFTPQGLTAMHLVSGLLKSSVVRPFISQPPQIVSPSPGYSATLRPLIQEAKELQKQQKASQMALQLRNGLVLHALHGNLLWTKSSQAVTGKRNVGISFFDTLVTKDATKRARMMDRLVVRSSWLYDGLRELGVDNAVKWHAGYDDWVFYPRDKKGTYGDTFVVYTGGALSLSGGQDIVLEAFKIFHERHPDSLLLTAWHTPFVQAVNSIGASPYGVGVPEFDEENTAKILPWCIDMGLKEESVQDIGLVGALSHPLSLSEADVALFANRATGGTNTFAMEAMAMGIPCILPRNTGHLDIIEDGNALTLDEQGPVDAPGIHTVGWGEPSIDEILAHLEWAYENRDAAKAIGEKGRETIAPFTWGRQTEALVDSLSDLLRDDET